MFTLICTRINGWVNNREAGDLRRHYVHYDVIVMLIYWTHFLRNPIKIDGHQLYKRRTRMRGCLRQYVSQYPYPGILSIANQSVTLPLDHYQWLFQIWKQSSQRLLSYHIYTIIRRPDPKQSRWRVVKIHQNSEFLTIDKTELKSINQLMSTSTSNVMDLTLKRSQE